LLTINRGNSLSDINEFIIENDYSFPILMDKNISVSRNYGISNLPTTIFIDKNGIIKTIKIGSYNSVEEIENDLASIQ